MSELVAWRIAFAVAMAGWVLTLVLLIIRSIGLVRIAENPYLAGSVLHRMAVECLASSGATRYRQMLRDWEGNR